MTAQTPAQRKAAERKRRKEAGLVELRGIWAHPEDATTIRAAAAKAAAARGKKEKQK